MSFYVINFRGKFPSKFEKRVLRAYKNNTTLINKILKIYDVQMTYVLTQIFNTQKNLHKGYSMRERSPPQGAIETIFELEGRFFFL